jgi:hypothetical protein
MIFKTNYILNYLQVKQYKRNNYRCSGSRTSVSNNVTYFHLDVVLAGVCVQPSSTAYDVSLWNCVAYAYSNWAGD